MVGVHALNANMKPFLILLMFIIGLTAVTSLSAEEQKIDIVLVKQPIRGKIGEVVKIHFEAVNNTSETFVIKNIIRVNDGLQMNGVLIRDGNRVHSSNLRANWDTTKKNPMEDVYLKPKEKQRLYVPSTIRGASTLKLEFGAGYHITDANVEVQVLE